MIEIQFLKKLVGVVLIVIGLVVFSIIALPWIILCFGGLSMPNLASPEITYGEFPFILEYEVNGERFVVKDSVFCEYVGTGWNEGQGKIRKWKHSLSSGNERISLVITDDGKEIYYDPGPAWYYMGDSDGASYSHSFPNASFIEKDGRFTVRGVIKEKELLDKYSIKLINWEFTQPLENNFIF